jgi:cell division protein FtsZ
MGIGSSRGNERAVQAAEMAISSPLLEASIDGAHGVLLSISGGSDLGLFEINEAAQLVAQAAHQEANIIFGAVIDDALGDEVRVTVIAAGFDGGTPRRRGAVAERRGSDDHRTVTRPEPRFEPSPEPRHEPRTEAPSVADIRVPVGSAGTNGHSAPSARPAEPATGPGNAGRVRPTRTIVFDDSVSDDLDVPDFLK